METACWLLGFLAFVFLLGFAWSLGAASFWQRRAEALEKEVDRKTAAVRQEGLEADRLRGRLKKIAELAADEDEE